MKKLLSLFSIVVLLASTFPVSSFAQVGASIPQPTRSAGKFFAASYGRWQTHTTSSTPASAGSIGSDVGLPTVNGSFNVSDARFLTVFPTTAPFPPILVDNGSVQESVTPTGASSCNSYLVANLSTGNVPICTITGTFANAHGAGALIQSGSAGLQEAINDAQASGGGVVVLDAAWQTLVNSNLLNASTLIANAVPFANVYIEDDRGPSTVFYAPRPSNQTALAAPAQQTITTGSGALTSGQYFVNVSYVDISGQIGQKGTESAQTATTTALSGSAPAASTGAVGYVLWVTAAGGATGTEVLVPAAQSGCTLTKLVTAFPVCAVTNSSYGQTGSAWAISANPATTNAKVIGSESAARTAYAYAAVHGLPSPFNAQLIGGVTTATGAGTNALAAITLPPGYFNTVGHKVRLCLTGHDTFGGVAGQTITINLLFGQYNNSDTSLLSLASAAGTATAGTQTARYCADMTTVSTGATGSMWAHGKMDINLANSNADSPVMDQASAPIGSLPLSAPTSNVIPSFLRITEATGAQSLAAGFTLDDLSIEPVSD